MSPALGVTIVVPIYGDLESLMACIESLKSSVDFEKHHVMLVNDVGPEADDIEAAVLTSIHDHNGFTYFRNPRNLGFVGTCNRAVLELDHSERDVLLLNSDTVATPGFVDTMLKVLYASDKHGVVTARSNSATIASLPYRLADPEADRSFERTRAVFEALADLLPEWTVPPVAMGFCFLTRKTLARRFGLFSTEFAPGYGEENDYCLRLGEAGFSSVIANRALVFHEGSKSFSSVGRNTIRDAHEKLLASKYPYYRRAVRSFNYFAVTGTEWFADVLVPRPGIKKIEFDFRGLGRLLSAAPQRARAGRRLTRSLIAPAASTYRVRVLVDSGDEALFDVDPSTVEIATETSETIELYDLGFTLADAASYERLIQANRRYLRLAAITLLDHDGFAWSAHSTDAPHRSALVDLRNFADWEVVLQGASPAFSNVARASSPVGKELAIGNEDELDFSAMLDEHGTSDRIAELSRRLEFRWSHFLGVEAVRDETRSG